MAVVKLERHVGAPQTEADPRKQGPGQPFGRRWHVDLWRALALLPVLAAAVFLATWLRTTDSKAPPAQMVSDSASVNQPAATRPGMQAPDFAYSTLDGRRLRLSDLRGRPVVLNLWASWCHPCEEEMPDLQRLQDSDGAQGLVVLGLNAGETSSEVRSFVEKAGVSYRIGLDPDLTVADAYHALGLPMTVLIDKRGVIRDVHLGQLTFREIWQLVQEKLTGGDKLDPLGAPLSR